MENKKLARIILQMVKLDQKVRKAYEKNSSLLKKMEEIDRSNLTKMKQVVEKFGWPTLTLVGKKASYSAWLLVQHADNDVRFQERCLRLMQQAAKKNEVSKTNIAFLTDRVLVNRGKPQIYGTQFYKNKNGKLVPRPIRNIKAVDKEREKMSLESFELYQKRIRKN